MDRRERPFRFGLNGLEWGKAGGIDPSKREWLRRISRDAESAGYDIITFADHVMPLMTPLIPALCAAEATKRIRFGTLVLNNDFWHPVLLARDVAAISLLTDGRFELGLGAGHAKPEYDAMGLPFDPPGTRVARLREAVPLIQAMVRGESVTARGEHYSLTEASSGAPPCAVPLLIGGNGRNVLTLAGQSADIVGLTGLARSVDNGHAHQPTWTDQSLAERIGIVRESAGARFDALELNALVQSVVVTNDRRSAAAAFCEEVRALHIVLDVEEALTTPFLLFGTVTQIVEQIRAHRERWGITYWSTRLEAFTAMSEVIALLG